MKKFPIRRKGRPVETSAAMEIEQGCLRRNYLDDFHRCLKKSAEKRRRLFHSYHRRDGGDYDNIINFSKETAIHLKRAVFWSEEWGAPHGYKFERRYEQHGPGAVRLFPTAEETGSSGVVREVRNHDRGSRRLHGSLDKRILLPLDPGRELRVRLPGEQPCGVDHG